MRWMILVMVGCGGGAGGGDDDPEPMAVCELTLELTGDRTETFMASSCGMEAPGHFMRFSFADDGSSVVDTSARLGLLPSIALGTQPAELEYRERRNGDTEEWTADDCSIEVTTSELLGEVDLAGSKRDLYQLAGTATCGVATNGTSEITIAPFSFQAGVLD